MPKEYLFPRRSYIAIKKAAAQADLYELAYLVFGLGKEVKRVIRVPNRADKPICQVVFGGRDFDRLRVRSDLLSMHFLGFLHTHPISRAIPGEGDIKGFPIGSLLFIYSDIYEELRAFRLINYEPGYVEKRIVLR
jgi:hypothetical protein